MLYPEDIVTVAYDPEFCRLTVVFDSCRKVVFYEVPPATCEKLVDSASVLEGYEKHVLGKFSWTEIGGLGPDEMRCRRQGASEKVC